MSNNTVRGLAADDAWQDLLAAPPARGTATSSFRHSLNLRVGGELLSILTVDAARAPGVLVAEAASLPSVAPGTPVALQGGVITVGSGPAAWRIDGTGCEPYSCTVDALSAREIALSPGTALGSAKTLTGVARTGSFLPSGSDGVVEQAVRRRLVRRCSAYQEHLAALIPGATTAAEATQRLRLTVAGLVGLGAGLTPSGDDYLVGSLAALHHLPGGAVTAGVIGTPIRAVLENTTEVSAASLRAAVDGRFHEHLARAASSALTADRDRVVASFAQAARIGATSGTDALYGLVHTLATIAAACGDPSQRRRNVVGNHESVHGRSIPTGTPGRDECTNLRRPSRQPMKIAAW